MSRVEPTNRPDEKRQAENRPDQHPAPEIGHTPGEAEGEEDTIDEALKNQPEKRRYGGWPLSAPNSFSEFRNSELRMLRMKKANSERRAQNSE